MANQKSSHAEPAQDAAKNGKSAKGAKTGRAAQAEPGKIQQLREFFDQSVAEMKKVTFPTRKETVATGIAVLVMVVFMSLFLGLVDFGLSKAIGAILS
ncbi:preprotein translocase subunit SecE [Desulfocurvus sp.]|jgi:preprotein translocase subunit SecE|uniref:preprotein translocase subunit SecE n=1 Tax=Desulfocurvus sp. TaxID=2871698 RepID=UPI0025C6B678|nr:preprotein translocase subunit SecE [Desulfocurvus sp.]MCK9240636.1 preprotein translocase subunit SecE [Desulfocurvus sp.]